MRSFYTLSIWILLGTFAGYGFLTLVGLGDKNEYKRVELEVPKQIAQIAKSNLVNLNFETFSLIILFQ